MNKLKCYFLLVCTFVASLTFAKSGLTYKVSDERFGDHLITYIKAKTAAYAFDLDFFYTPFKYSDQLVLHDRENSLLLAHRQGYTQSVRMPSAGIFDSVSEHKLYISDVMLVLPDIWQSFWDDMYPFVQKNPDLKFELQTLICPKNSGPKLNLPQDRVSVAVHIRKGGGFDKPQASQQLYSGHEDKLIYYSANQIPIKQFNKTKGLYSYGYPTDMRFPIKLPPDQYYVDQIKKIYTVTKQPLHVHIFTDDQDPVALMHRIKKAVGIADISYTCCTQDNYHMANVLEDFFAMMQCDCLIMPWSNFSRCVQLIGDFKIIIHPFDGYWENNCLVIDKLVFIDNRKVS